MSEIAVAADALPEPQHPDQRCPKCGDLNGFLWSRPDYVPGTSRDWSTIAQRSRASIYYGALRWICRTCGWVTYTPTADTPEHLR